jgi:hypothetical protein
MREVSEERPSVVPMSIVSEFPSPIMTSVIEFLEDGSSILSLEPGIFQRGMQRWKENGTGIFVLSAVPELGVVSIRDGHLVEDPQNSSRNVVESRGRSLLTESLDVVDFQTPRETSAD